MFSAFQLNIALLLAISSGLREFLRAFKDGTMGNIINNNRMLPVSITLSLSPIKKSNCK